MGSIYSNDLISQLNLGEGQPLYGDTLLVILKSFLQSGVSSEEIVKYEKDLKQRLLRQGVING